EAASLGPPRRDCTNDFRRGQGRKHCDARRRRAEPASRRSRRLWCWVDDYSAGWGAGRSLARKIAGATAIAVAPRANAVTPIASSATPPSRAREAAVRLAIRSLRPRSLPRSAGLVASASWAVAATNEKF